MQPAQLDGTSCGAYTLLNIGLRLHDFEVSSTTYKAFEGAKHLRTLFANALVRDQQSGFAFKQFRRTHEPYIWKDISGENPEQEKKDAKALLDDIDKEFYECTEDRMTSDDLSRDPEIIATVSRPIHRANRSEISRDLGDLLFKDFLSVIDVHEGQVKCRRKVERQGGKFYSLSEQLPAPYYGFLTDNVMNFCFAHMQECAWRAWKNDNGELAAGAPRDHYLRTYFGLAFQGGKFWDAENRTFSVDGEAKYISRLTMRTSRMYGYDVKDCERIFLPLNTLNGPSGVGHWYLCVIDKNNKTIVTYCSVSDRGYDMEWLKRCASCFFVDIPKESWTYEVGEVPHQTNEYDCGVHTIANALIVSSTAYVRRSYTRNMYAWAGEEMRNVRLWIASRMLEDAGEEGLRDSFHVHRKYT